MNGIEGGHRSVGTKGRKKGKKRKETEWKMEIEIIGRGRREGEMSRGAH